MRACVLWESNFAAHSAQSSDSTPKDKDTAVRVKMEVDGDNLLDGTLCMVLDFSKLGSPR